MSNWTHPLTVIVPESLIPQGNQLALDQLICGVIWLRPDHTISGEVGYAAYHGKRWGRIAERFIDALFGKGHCFNSIEWDEVNKPQFKIWK